MKYLPLLALLACLLGSGFTPPVEWAPKEFPISFWCGPPAAFITLERYREIAQAGFNLVMPPCEGASSTERNRKILAAAKAAGLKAFLQDNRMPSALTGVADGKERIDAIVKDYAKHPAFAGYSLTDEPGARAFKGLGEVVAYLREKDPKHPAYINLFPNYASPEQLGAATYDAYLNRYASEVKPFAISYDHYHFLKGGDRPGFFDNLESARAAAERAEVPFWQIVLAIPHGPYRQLTEAEKRWEAMQTLAYGGKGLLYFTYWQPTDSSFDWGAPLVTKDGAKTPQYDEVKRINADVRELGKYLLDALPPTVFQAGNLAPGGRPRPQGAPVVFPRGGDVTTGLFRRDTHLYALFANRDYKNPTTAEVALSTGGHPVEKLNRATGKWAPVKAEKTPDNDLLITITLAAGDGELYRW